MCRFKKIDLETTPRIRAHPCHGSKHQVLIKEVFNTSGIDYRELGLKDKIADLSLQAMTDLLASDGMLIKRPILLDEDGKILQIGYRTDYETLLA